MGMVSHLGIARAQELRDKYARQMHPPFHLKDPLIETERGGRG
jgi:hypothetical protein